MLISNNSKNIVLYSVILIGFLTMFLSSSVKNVFQVYFVDISTSFDLSRAVFSWSGTVFMLVTGVGSWTAGIMCDRIGAKLTIVVGSFLIGISLILSTVIDNFPFFVATYGGMAALALAAVQYVPMGVIVDDVFSEKNKGMAFALLTNGAGLGFIILSPLWVYLNIYFQWQQVFLWLGLVFAIFLSPTIMFCLRMPSGETKDVQKSDNLWRSALTKPAFWFLAVSFFGCGVNMAFIDIHYVPMMQDRDMNPSMVALALSLLGAVEVIGGGVAGWLSGRMKPALLLSGFYGLRAVSGILLYQSTTASDFLVFSALFGATYLGTIIVTSLFCLHFFGNQNKGTIFGLLFFIHQIGASLSTWAGANLFDLTGDYLMTIAIATGFSIFSAVVALFLLGVSKREQKMVAEN